MTNLYATTLRTTGTTTGLISGVRDLLPDMSCVRVQRFLDSNSIPALDYYTGHQIDGLEYLMGTVYAMDACRLINKVDRLVVCAAIDALHQEGAKVDVYRAYAETLRRIIDRKNVNSASARDVLRSLYLEQTRPDDELENPQHVDSYTQEPFEDEGDIFEVGKACDKFLAGEGKKVEIKNDDLFATAIDLGWKEKEFDAHIAAQSAFNEDEDVSTPEEKAREDLLVDPREREVTTFQQPADYKDERDLALAPIVKKVNRIVHLIMKGLKEVPEEFKKAELRRRMNPTAWRFFRRTNNILVSDDQIGMVANLLQGKEIPMSEVSGQYEKEPVMDAPLSEERPVDIDPTFIDELGATFEKNSANPVHTPEYNLAKIQAVSAGATLDQANKAAWTAWKGRKSHIKSITKDVTGLMLDSGRKITWKVAQMKLVGGEFEFKGDEKTRLSTKLAELHVCNDFTKTLAK